MKKKQDTYFSIKSDYTLLDSPPRVKRRSYINIIDSLREIKYTFQSIVGKNHAVRKHNLMKITKFILIPLLIWSLVGTHLWVYYEGLNDGQKKALVHYKYPSQDSVRAFVRGYLKDKDLFKRQVLFWQFEFDEESGWIEANYDFYPTKNYHIKTKLQLKAVAKTDENPYGLEVYEEPVTPGSSQNDGDRITGLLIQ